MTSLLLCILACHFHWEVWRGHHLIIFSLSVIIAAISMLCNYRTSRECISCVHCAMHVHAFTCVTTSWIEVFILTKGSVTYAKQDSVTHQEVTDFAIPNGLVRLTRSTAHLKCWRCEGGQWWTIKVLNFWKFSQKWEWWIPDNYCSLKPLLSGMGEVVPARTSSTLHPPSPPTVL